MKQKGPLESLVREERNRYFFRFHCSSVTEEKRQCSAQKEKSLIFKKKFIL